ncbi:MAG: hypothetical protein KJ592_02680 [Nanoarchaeota archaeon]|nr:hypothetical protein [Nanoarchaeota archaeon]
MKGFLFLSFILMMSFVVASSISTDFMVKDNVEEISDYVVPEVSHYDYWEWAVGALVVLVLVYVVYKKVGGLGKRKGKKRGKKKGSKRKGSLR